MATIDIGRKEGDCCASFAESCMGPRLIQCGLGRDLLRTKWRLHPSSRLATIDMNRKLGDVPLLGGSATPSNTTSTVSRFTFVPSGILIHPAVWPQWTSAKNWAGWVCLFFWGQLGPSRIQSRLPRFIPSKWHLSPSSRLTTTDIGRKLEAMSLYGGRAGFLSNTLLRRPIEACFRTK